MRKISQHDERDCGAACFATVLSCFGTQMTLQEAREKVKVNLQGTSIYNIVAAGRELKLETDAYETDFYEMFKAKKNGQIHTPFIAHIITEENIEHFVVVLSINEICVKIFDPAIGIRRYSIQKFCCLWTGRIITFSKTEDYEPQKTKQKNSFYAEVIKKCFKWYVVTIVLSILGVCISLMGTMGYQIVVDDIVYGSYEEIAAETEHEDHHHDSDESYLELGAFTNILKKTLDIIPLDEIFSNVETVLIILIGLYISQFFLQFTRDVIVGWLSRNIDIAIMNMYRNKMFQLPVSFFTQLTSGEIMSRFADMSETRSLMSGYSLAILFDSIVFVLGCLMMYLINPLLFGLVLIVSAIYATLIIVFSIPIARINRNYMSKSARMTSDFKELVDGIETVKFCDCSKLVNNKLEQDFLAVTRTSFKGNVICGIQNAIAVMLESVSVILVLYIGYDLVLSGNLSIGYLMTFSMLIAYVLMPIKDLVEMQSTIQRAIVSTHRMNDVVYVKEEDRKQIDEHQITGDIKFCGVSFSYEEDVPVITNFDLDIKDKERVMIRGKNGSGKSTLIKLLLGALSPSAGKITVNGRTTSSYSVDMLRKQIIYVPQDVYLFSGTLKENITAGDKSIKDDEIAQVLQLVKLHGFVSSLPNGLDTYLFENGTNLSGGEKQKIAIARALMKQPRVLVLDETMSQIDEQSCVILIAEMFKAYPNTTFILISHNNALSVLCDREVNIDGCN